MTSRQSVSAREAARDADRRALEDTLSGLHWRLIPCRADATTCANWISDVPAHQRAAAAACMPCPALAACKGYGLAWPAEEGTYGALTQAERRALAARARREAGRSPPPTGKPPTTPPTKERNARK